MTDRNSIAVREQDGRSPYRLREHFLTTPELALFRIIQKVVGRHYLICPKVALNDVFYIVRPNENVHFFNNFFRKHVDFLLCEPETLKPAFGIELVKPVSRGETRKGDQFMEDLFRSVGLPLVHVQSSEHYSEQDLTELFELAVMRVKETKPIPAAAKTDSVPQCPVCGRMMVLRVYRAGRNAGKNYYGCVDNPHCPGVLDIS